MSTKKAKVGNEGAERSRSKASCQSTGQVARGLVVESGDDLTKSLFMNTLRERAQSRGIRSLSVKCHSRDVMKPYQPFVELLTGYLGGMKHPIDGKLKAAIDASPYPLVGVLPILGRFRSSWGGFDDLKKEVVASEIGKSRENIFDGMSRLIMGIAEGSRLLLCFEDVHWSDTTSINLMSYLLRSISDSGIVMVVTYNPQKLVEAHGSIAEMASALERDGLVAKAKIDGQPRADIDALASSVLDAFETHQEPQPQSITGPRPEKRIDEPGIVEADLLVEDGARLMKRIELLDDEAKAVLCTASVIGRVFGGDILRCAIDEKGIEPQLDVLVGRGIVKPSSRGDETFEFISSEGYEMIYASLDEDRRRNAHDKVGRCLEKLYENKLDDVVYDLGFHFITAGDLEKSLEYSTRAGEKAMHSLAPHEAISFYNLALDALQKLRAEGKREKKRYAAREAAIRGGLGTALYVVGQWNDAVSNYKKAISISEGIGKPDVTARLNIELGFIYINESMWDEALDCFERTKRACGAVDDVVGVAEAAFGVAMVHYKKGDYPRAVEEFRGCIGMLDGAGSGKRGSDLARFTRMLGAAHYRMGELDAAEECFNRSLAFYVENKDEAGIANTNHRLGMLANKRGEHERAVRYYSQALRIFTREGNVFEMSRNHINLGEAYFNLGKMDLALENYKKAEELNRRIGNRYGLAIAFGLQGRVHMARGELPRAGELFDENLKLCQELGSQFGLGMVKRDIGVLRYLSHEVGEGVALLRESILILKGIKSGDAALVEALLGLVLSDLGEQEGDRILEKYAGTDLPAKANKLLGR